MGRPANDLINKKFGKLIVKSRTIGTNPHDAYWVCQCICGDSKIVTSSHLVRGEISTCGKRECKSGLTKGESGFNYYIHSLKQSAKSRGGRAFKLSKKRIKELSRTNCFYCGAPPSRKCVNGKYKTQAAKDWATYTCNGIDRVDNEKGYISSNCVACCTICNLMKRNMTEIDFLEHIDKIYYHKYEQENLNDPI